MKDIKLRIFLMAIVAMISLCGCEYLETEVTGDQTKSSSESSNSKQDEGKVVTLEDVQAEIVLKSIYNQGETSGFRIELKAFGKALDTVVLSYKGKNIPTENKVYTLDSVDVSYDETVTMNVALNGEQQTIDLKLMSSKPDIVMRKASNPRELSKQSYVETIEEMSESWTLEVGGVKSFDVSLNGAFVLQHNNVNVSRQYLFAGNHYFDIDDLRRKHSSSANGVSLFAEFKQSQDIQQAGLNTVTFVHQVDVYKKINLK